MDFYSSWPQGSFSTPNITGYIQCRVNTAAQVDNSKNYKLQTRVLLFSDIFTLIHAMEWSSFLIQLFISKQYLRGASAATQSQNRYFFRPAWKHLRWTSNVARLTFDSCELSSTVYLADNCWAVIELTVFVYIFF